MTYAEHEGEIVQSNVAGFVYVSDVVERDGETHLVLLCPRMGPLPGNNILLASTFRTFLD